MSDGLIAVFDAGPLIHLSELKLLKILNIFKNKIITQTVFNEVIQYMSKEEISWLEQNFKIITEIEIAEKVKKSAILNLLDLGEITSLSYIINSKKNLKTFIFLSDDSAARVSAGELKIKSVGTIGLIIKAATNGLLDKYRALDIIKKIKFKSTLHIKTDLLIKITEQILEEWKL